mmetsp:Transcript_6506/g.20905  ORF Transcript_6506/g.20905 Transcript_6506/m.20905 type:complete len:281 (-) Transcript_6506:818-1660(-)
MSTARRSVVVAQDLQGQLHAGQSLLKICLVLGIVRVLLAPQLVHVGLGGCELRQRLLQRGYLLLEPGRLRRGLVDLGAELLDLGVLLGLLRGCLGEVLVAVRLVTGVCAGLILELRDHVGDQALDLGKRVLAAHGAGAHCRGGPGGELRESGGVLPPSEITDKSDGLKLDQIRARGELHEGRLAQTVHGLFRVPRGLLDDGRGLADCLDLLIAALGGGLVVLCLGHTVPVQVSQGLGVHPKVLGRHLEISLCGCLALAALRQARLRLSHVLLRKLDRVLQ